MTFFEITITKSLLIMDVNQIAFMKGMKSTKVQTLGAIRYLVACSQSTRALMSLSAKNARITEEYGT